MLFKDPCPTISDGCILECDVEIKKHAVRQKQSEVDRHSGEILESKKAS
jgi:hypothetical protein